jgi:hypothetical protein
VDPAAALAVRLTTRGAFGIFPQETPVGALAAGGVSMRLFGTSISPGRQAALISAGGARPVWLVMGEPQTGVELVDLAPGRAVIRTSTGDTITLALFPAKASPAAAGPEEVSHGG